MNVQFVDAKKFTHNHAVHSFTIFRLLEPGNQPTAIFGKEGDLLLDGDCTWVRYSECWKKAITGEDEQGRALQKHPNITGHRLIGTEWRVFKKQKCTHHQETEEVQACGDQISFDTPSFKSTIRLENEWIRDVRRKWDTPSIFVIPKLYKVGKGILEKLLDTSQVLPSNPMDESMIILLGKPKRTSVAPSIRLVLNDILQGEDPNVTEFILRSCEIGIGPLDVVASMMNPMTLCDMESSERRLYGALDIPMTGKGLGLCGYTVEKYEDGKDNYVPKKVWTTTLTPPGAITHTHMDFYGRYQYMVHLFGHKLWLLWPPTPRNLEKLWSNHTQYANADLTERCIDEMEGLQAFYTTEEQVFMIKPNVLHACVSVATSGHSATWFWRLKTHQESLRMVKWGLNWLKAKVSSDAPRTDYEEGIKIIEDEMKVWNEMVKRNTEMEELKIEVERLDGLLKEVKGLFKPVAIVKNCRTNKRRRK